MKLKFNQQRALEIFKILAYDWQNKIGVFKNVVLPQDIYQWPKPYDKRKYANWLFFSALPMRGALISEGPFKVMWALKQDFPEIFEPEVVARNLSPKDIEEAFKKTAKKNFKINEGKNEAGPLSFKLSDLIKAWHENSVRLYRYWGSNVLNVFWGVTEYEEAFTRIDHKKRKAGFKGMRRKIFALLVIFLQEKKLIEVFPSPLPVDFHALRILCNTEIMQNWHEPLKKHKRLPWSLIGRPGRSVAESFIDEVTKWSQKLFTKSGISHLDINPATWVLSRSLCARQFQNTSFQRTSVDQVSFVETEDLEKGKIRWPKGYRDPCNFCPIEKLCQWTIPNSPYYQGGFLVRLGKRVDYGVKHLTGIEWKDFTPNNFKKQKT